MGGEGSRPGAGGRGRHARGGSASYLDEGGTCRHVLNQLCHVEAPLCFCRPWGGMFSASMMSLGGHDFHKGRNELAQQQRETLKGPPEPSSTVLLQWAL